MRLILPTAGLLAYGVLVAAVTWHVAWGAAEAQTIRCTELCRSDTEYPVGVYDPSDTIYGCYCDGDPRGAPAAQRWAEDRAVDE